jgi:hypothetical protein
MLNAECRFSGVGGGGVTELKPVQYTAVCIEWDTLNAFLKDFNACEKFSRDKTTAFGQRLRIFMVKYDFCILLRGVTIVKMQLFQWRDLNRLAVLYQ